MARITDTDTWYSGFPTEAGMGISTAQNSHVLFHNLSFLHLLHTLCSSKLMLTHWAS